MLIGDPSLGFMTPAAPPPGVPGDVSTARFTGVTLTPPGTKLKGLTYYGSSIYVGGENDLRKYDGVWGGPLSSFTTNGGSSGLGAYPTITSAKILVPDLTRVFWTNTAEYAWSATCAYNNISSLSSIGQNTSFPSRVTTLEDMAWDRYGSYAYMTDSAGKRVMRFDISDLNIVGTITPPFMDQIDVSAHGTPYRSHINWAGTKIYIALVKTNGRAVVVQYALPTAYSLVGATYEKVSPELEAGIVVPGGLALGFDTAARTDALMFVGDRDSRTIYEYSMSP